MNSTSIKFHVPGKLALSGEWGILIPGNTCITLSTHGIDVHIEQSQKTLISSPTYGLNQVPYNLLVQQHQPENTLLINAIKTALQLAHDHEKQILNFNLSLENKPQTYIQTNGVIKKLGIGSSACVTVGVIKAITLLHGIDLDTSTLFKLAAKTHYTSQQKLGSCFDIAAAAAGQPIIYQSFSANGAINQNNWDLLKIKPIIIPKEWIFAIGYSGRSANTVDLIKNFNTARSKYSVKIKRILKQINTITHNLTQAIESHNLQAGMTLINENGQLLRELSGYCNNQLETPALTKMIQLANAQGAVAKFSGAGGGDCVIALCKDDKTKQEVCKAWNTAGFLSINNLLMI